MEKIILGLIAISYEFYGFFFFIGAAGLLWMTGAIIAPSWTVGITVFSMGLGMVLISIGVTGPSYGIWGKVPNYTCFTEKIEYSGENPKDVLVRVNEKLERINKEILFAKKYKAINLMTLEEDRKDREELREIIMQEIEEYKSYPKVVESMILDSQGSEFMVITSEKKVLRRELFSGPFDGRTMKWSPCSLKLARAAQETGLMATK